MFCSVRGKRGFTAIELVAVVCIIALLISMLLPAVQNTREAARRIHCQNNLRQIGIALANYHEAFRVLPPGCVNETGPVQSTARGYHVSWLVQIQPQLGFPARFETMDFATGAYSQINKKLSASAPSVLQCLSAGSSRGQSNYAGCHHHVEAPIDSDNQGVLFLNSSIARDDLVDGLTYTLTVGEFLPVTTSLGWLSGTRATLRNTGQLDNQVTAMNRAMERADLDASGLTAQDATEVGSFGSAHATGLNFLLADGSVRFVSFGLAPHILERLANRNDGEIVGTF